MVRKIIGMVVALALFFGLTLNAAAAPVSSTPVNNIYTQSHGAMADNEMDVLPGYPVDWLQVEQGLRQVVQQLQRQFQIIGIPKIEEQSLDNRVEIVFDY